MACSVCGDICRCVYGDSTASPRWLADGDSCPTPDRGEKRPEGPTIAEAPSLPSAGEVSTPNHNARSEMEDDGAWRNEVAERLNRYQAKRKPRPPRYPSLRLRFEEPDSAYGSSSAPDDSSFYPQNLGSTSQHALALDNFANSSHGAFEAVASGRHSETPEPEQRSLFIRRGESSPQPPAPAIPGTATGRIIEFPRCWTPTPPPLDELAEPVVDHPRILEAPESVPPPPALGGITIEPAIQLELERRPGIDIPLQSAPLSRRILSAAVDSVIIASAACIFGFIFWKMTGIEPPRLQLAGLVAGLLAVFWAAYQYLLVVYSGSTPGLRLAKLELSRFDGTPANRRLRRWRILTSFLSAVSLGMGYAWVFLDEDALCWHDRISHTYLAPKRAGNSEVSPA